METIFFGGLAWIVIGIGLLACGLILWSSIVSLFSSPKEAIKRGVKGFLAYPILYLVGLVAFVLGVVGELETRGPHPYLEDPKLFGLAALPVAEQLFDRKSSVRKALKEHGWAWVIFYWAIAALFMTALMTFGEFLAETFVG